MILPNVGIFMPLTLILSVGLHPALLRSRNITLESAEYLVVPALSLKEAVDQFLAGDFDLVLLGHFIPPIGRDRLTSFFRASGSLVPIVSISEVYGQQDALADATLENDPKKLLTAIKEVLGKAARISGAKTTMSDDKRETHTGAATRNQHLPDR